MIPVVNLGQYWLIVVQCRRRLCPIFSVLFPVDDVYHYYQLCFVQIVIYFLSIGYI